MLVGVDQGSTIGPNRRVRRNDTGKVGVIAPNEPHCSYGVTVDFGNCTIYISTDDVTEMCAEPFCEREAQWRFRTPSGIRHACNLLSHAPYQVYSEGVKVV